MTPRRLTRFSVLPRVALLILTLTGCDDPSSAPDDAGDLTRLDAGPDAVRPGDASADGVDAGDAARDVAPGPCQATAEEPNDTPAEALALPAIGSLDATLCEDDLDWYAVALPAGATLTARLSFDGAAGVLELALLRGDETLERALGQADEAWLQVGPFDAAQALHLQVRGLADAQGDYALRHSVLGPATGSATLRGQVTYDDPLDGRGARVEPPTTRPLRRGRVEVVRDHDGARVAEGQTDDAGAFALTVGLHEGFTYVARASAAVEVAQLEADVREASNGALYAIASAPLTLVAGADAQLALHADLDSGAAGPLHIADVTVDAMALITAHSDRPAPPLTYVWRAGESTACGSCFTSGRVHLLGLLSDPDEFDDDIIRHEYGHYFVHHFSLDSSPGGPHRDRQVSPQLAYGEGVAYFFSALATHDPLIVDTFLDGRRLIDLEAVTQNGAAHPDLVGTADGTWTGDLREEIVAAIMWDALDPFNFREPFDALALDAGAHMAILLDRFDPDAGMALDLGAAGVDLVDWLNAAGCVHPSARGELEALAADRGFPWTADAARCDFKGEAPATLRLERRGGRLWLGATGPVALPLDVERRDLDVGRRGRVVGGAGQAVRCAALPCEVGAAAAHTSVLVRVPALGGAALTWHGHEALRQLGGGAPWTRWSPRGPVRHHRSRGAGGR